MLFVRFPCQESRSFPDNWWPWPNFFCGLWIPHGNSKFLDLLQNLQLLSLIGETETTFSLTYFYLYLVNAWIDLVQILRESSKPNVYFSLYLVYECVNWFSSNFQKSLANLRCILSVMSVWSRYEILLAFFTSYQCLNDLVQIFKANVKTEKKNCTIVFFNISGTWSCTQIHFAMMDRWEQELSIYINIILVESLFLKIEKKELEIWLFLFFTFW